MNFKYNNGINIPYYDVDFFGCPSENFNYLINGENINIE